MDRSALTPSVDSPGREIRLDDWIAAHGPLAPRSAAMIALQACARASNLSVFGLRTTIGSLNTTGIVRDKSGSWSWAPTSLGSARYAAADADVIERLGAILFECLTGQPAAGLYGTQEGTRSVLRRLRPELSADVANVVVRALWSPRCSSRLTLSAFARELRRAFGVEFRGGSRASTALPTSIGVIAVGLAILLWWTAIGGGEGRTEAHGLTRLETMTLDILTETAQTFAMMDEHTAALQRHQQIQRMWRSRVSPDDPRPLWDSAREAWVRTLAGDRLTTEQLLKNPSALGSALGDAHPYTRAVRLLLAATLEARGAAADASALRDQAEMAGRALIAVTGDLTPGVPAPPGVVAHLAPNPPEREGFRRRPDGSFFTPLTSTQRLLAGRDGWRLHVIVSGTCRASIVIGNVPHLIALHASRSADGSWETRVEGTAPPQTMRLEAAERPRISVVADGAGGVEVRWPEGRVTPLRMDHEAVAPDPPYSMTFSGDNGAAGCDLVWLEIPFPLEPRS